MSAELHAIQCTGAYNDLPDRKDCIRAGHHVCGKLAKFQPGNWVDIRHGTQLVHGLVQRVGRTAKGTDVVLIMAAFLEHPSKIQPCASGLHGGAAPKWNDGSEILGPEVAGVALDEHHIWALQNALRVMDGEVDRTDLACWPEHCDALRDILARAEVAR